MRDRAPVGIIWQPRLHCGVHQHGDRNEEELAILVLTHRCLRIREGIEDQQQKEIAIFALVHCCLPDQDQIEGKVDVVDVSCAW